MLALVASLIPLMIGSAILPTWISLITLLLDSPDGTHKAIAFVGGVTTIRLIQGFGAGSFLERTEQFARDFSLSMVPPAVLTVAGAILLVVGAISLRNRADPNGEPSRVFGIVENAGILKCGLVGAGLILASPRQWLFTLSAIAMIRGTNLGPFQEGVAFVIFTIGAQSLILAPIVTTLIKGDHRDTVFDRFADYLTANGRRIMGVLSLLIGAYLLWRGIRDLMAL